MAEIVYKEDDSPEQKIKVISDILNLWGGFSSSERISTSPTQSLWDLFHRYNDDLCDCIITQIAAKYEKDKIPRTRFLSNKLLYASLCLLSPDTTEKKPYEKFKNIVTEGFGVLIFDLATPNYEQKFGWTAIRTSQQEMETHYKRNSLLAICRDYRKRSSKSKCVTDWGKSADAFCYPTKNDKCEFSCASDSGICCESQECKGYFEKVVLSTTTGKIAEPNDLCKYSEKCNYESFLTYTDWLQRNIPNARYYRKPLVKSHKDFWRGEIYLAIKDSGVDQEIFAVDVIQLIRDYVGVPLLVKQMDIEHKRTKEQKARLAKSEQMLNLLSLPLESLTNALQNVQEDTQQLRSILYDPHRAIFAAASRAMKYFEDKRSLQIGDVAWEGVHTPGGSEMLTELANTLAAVVLEVFGKASAAPKNKYELYGIANALLTAREPSFERLKSLCKTILQIDRISDDADPKQLRRATERFKEVLFTPYKDNEVFMPLLPLFIILCDSGDGAISIKLNSKPLDGLQQYIEIVKKDFLDKDIKVPTLFNRDSTLKLPVPRYSHLLSFISGILAYAVNERTSKIESAEISTNDSSTLIDFTFANRVFETDKLKPLIEDFKKIINTDYHPVTIKGNFYKPFYDFASRCSGKATNLENQIIISYEKCRFMIMLAETKLEIRVRSGE